MGRRSALLIATYDYQDAGLRQLAAPAHDAEALATVLRDPEIAGFDVTTLVNKPLQQVGEAIGDFYRERRRDDLTLLYFTGHGLKDDDGRLYLAMTNTRRDSLLFTGLSAEQIDRAMEGCSSRQKVLILDCCYSGAFPAGHLAKADTAVHTLERFQGRGRTVLTASDSTQYSFEGGQAHGEAVQSVFTRYLVAGLRDGSADLDGDGDITLDELYSYVHDRVVEERPQQRPKKQDNVEGRTVIARNINWTLPVHLRNAIASPIAKDRLGALDGLAHLHRVGNEAVRGVVQEEVRRLADDDSKVVSAAAVERLRSSGSAPAVPVATVLRDARTEAAAVLTRAEAEAARIRKAAVEHGATLIAAARANANEEADHILQRARAEAEHLLGQARAQAAVETVRLRTHEPARCESCSSALDPLDTFCGECGFSLLGNEAGQQQPPPGEERLHYFEIARRGYDPDQVARYLATPKEQRGPIPTFDLVRRGYNRAQVDEHIRQS
ncbi:caspase family protein [Kitasatospora sp. NPDC006697]|uniref:caspase, EACC1-associated type n=1 Tax=Kitasatospora sp. NPDC006697 TaxID=3364020 RepID=UPI0036762BF1